MLAPWKESCDQPRRPIKKQRHYFASKGLSCQSYGFSNSRVWMWECLYSPIKKAECQRINSFELWHWRRLLRVPWTARRFNQSILKKISPEYSFKGSMPKLKLQYFGNLMRRADSFEKTRMLGKIEVGGEGMTEDEMVGWHNWLNCCECEEAPWVGDGQGSLAWGSPWGSKELGMTERLNWTDLQ